MNHIELSSIDESDSSGSSIEKLPLGDLSDERVQMLWDKFYIPLKQSISARVKKIRRPVANDSEIALSAFNSLIQGAREGRFPDLNEESGLWKLLRVIALRKANDAQKRLWAEKRGGMVGPIGQHHAELGEPAAINTVPATAPGPDANLRAEELIATLLESLPNEKHRNVILLKLSGADNIEIAENLNTTTRSVQRTLQTAREHWSKIKD